MELCKIPKAVPGAGTAFQGYSVMENAREVMA